MIHDSGSFLVEYISTNKPSLYMVRNKSILRGFSPFADLIVNCHYLSFNKNDIENFINKIVIGCDDYLKDKRQQLIKEHLLPPNGKSASQNIFEEINKNLPRINKIRDKKYKMSFSFGILRYDYESEMTFDDFIKTLDAKMYYYKKRKYKASNL